MNETRLCALQRQQHRPHHRHTSVHRCVWENSACCLFFDQEFTAPASWIGVEDGFRKRPRMSPRIEERALPFAIHVIRGFSENSGAGSLGMLEEFVDTRNTERDAVCSGTL